MTTLSRSDQRRRNATMNPPKNSAAEDTTNRAAHSLEGEMRMKKLTIELFAVIKV